MASSQSITDRLLKRLHYHLAEKIRPARLRALGWYDYRSQDHSDETDAVTLAHSAFVYLSFDQEGNWNSGQDVLVAVMAFLHAETGNQATEANVRELAAHLRLKPVSTQAIKDWLDRVYS